MEKSTIAGIVLIILAVIGLAWLVNGMWTNWQVSLQYERDLGGSYEYADRASDAQTKSMYFDKYMSELQKQGLNQGYSSVYFQQQPDANLANEWAVATSLQDRLHQLLKMDPNSMQYQQGIQEISMTEFCYFPDGAFEQGYDLNHGAWGAALTPYKVTNSCPSH